MSIDLTVIIPCYNEESRLKHLFKLINTNLHHNWEWLFVDDGSIDETSLMIKEFCKTAPEKITMHSMYKNCGKGRAVRTGFLEAKGALVGYVDADLSASPMQFIKYLNDQGVIAGKKIIAGIRVKTLDGRVERLLFRHFIGRCFQTYASVITGITAYDTQCGFKLLSKKVAQQIEHQMTIDGFAFDVELLLIAHRMEIQVEEVMIHWKEVGGSKIRLPHIIQMAIDIIKISRHKYEFRTIDI